MRLTLYEAEPDSLTAKLRANPQINERLAVNETLESFNGMPTGTELAANPLPGHNKIKSTLFRAFLGSKDIAIKAHLLPYRDEKNRVVNDESRELEARLRTADEITAIVKLRTLLEAADNSRALDVIPQMYAVGELQVPISRDAFTNRLGFGVEYFPSEQYISMDKWGGVLSYSQVLEVANRLAAILDDWLVQYFTHNDLKPSNILIKYAIDTEGVIQLVYEGGQPVIKIIDYETGAFNKRVSPHVYGTALYMADERMNPDKYLDLLLDGKTISHELALLIWFLLVGASIYKNDNNEQISSQNLWNRIVYGSLVGLPLLKPALETHGREGELKRLTGLFTKAISSRDKNLRYVSASRFAEALSGR